MAAETMDTLPPDTTPAPTHVPAMPVDAPLAPRSGWSAQVGLDRRGWMVLGGIAAFGAVMGVAMARDLHRSPLIPLVLAAAMVVCLARAGWGWLRGTSRRARLREGVLSRVEEYGGGVYGTGAGITLLVLSAASLREEWARAGGWMDFLRGMTWEFWMGFSGDSIGNAVQAGIWPIHWFANHGSLAVLAVGAAAWAGDALADAWRRREPVAMDEATDGEVPVEGRSTALGRVDCRLHRLPRSRIRSAEAVGKRWRTT